MDGYTFYAYWNGQIVRNLLEALAAVRSSTEFLTLSTCLVLAMIIGALLIGSTRAEGRHVITSFACCVLFWFIAVAPRVTVVVHDVRSAEVYPVANVPAGIGIVASSITRIGWWLTQTYENVFSSVDADRYSRFGAVFPERALEVMQSLGPVTSEGRSTFDALMRHCVMPELLTDRTKAAALTHSTDLWADISRDGWVNPARSAPMPDGTVLRCPAAMEYAGRVLEEVELPAVKAVLGSRLAGTHADPSAMIAAALPQAESLLLGLSRSMDASLKHALMLTVVPQAVKSAAVRSESPLALAVGLAKAQGSLASEINYRTMARIAEESLPKIRNALEVVIIACFPLIVLLSLAMGRAMGGVLRSYLMLLVTVELWPALCSVVNFLMIAVDAHPYSRIAEAFGGNSLAAASLIRETGAGSQAIAGFLMCAVPMISYALVRAGDMAVGQLVGNLTAPAQAAASGQGASLASGNISQGNVSLENVSTNNRSANQANRSIRAADSGKLVTGDAYGEVTRTEGGAVTGATRTAISLGLSQSETGALMRSTSASNAFTHGTARTSSARLSISDAMQSTDAAQRTFAGALREALGEMRAAVSSSSASESASRSISAGSAVAATSTDQVSEASEFSSSGRVGAVALPGAGGSGPAAVAAGSGTRATGGLATGMSVKDAQSLIDRASGEDRTASETSSSRAYSQVKSAADTIARTHSDESVRSAARSFSAALTASRSAIREQMLTQSSAQTASSTVAETKSGALTTTLDGSADVLRSAVSRFGSPEQALRAMYSRSSQMQLAEEAGSARAEAMSSADPVGPAGMRRASDLNAEYFAGSRSEVDAAHAAQGAHVRRSAKAALEEVPGPETIADPAAGSGRLTERMERAGGAAASGLDRTRGEAAFERGLLLVSRAAYREASRDSNFALRNALFFGAGYRDTAEIASGLRDMAAKNPALAAELSRVGASPAGRIDDQLFRRLATAARLERDAGTYR